MEPLIVKEDVEKMLRTVIDPEMHIDIFTLGLVYQITIDDQTTKILMTLTTPLCPYADAIVAEVKAAVGSLGKAAEVQVTFTPPWVAPPALRAILGV